MANTQISLSSLDPDSLKQSFITYLQNSQTIFKDYNYKGPNISVLMDLMSRNTFLNSFLVNMGFNESMLDSAQLRNSIVSRVKNLNYIPGSVTSSLALVNVAITSTSGNSFVIPKGTSFNGINANGVYQFVTDKEYFQSSANGYFLFPNVAIYDGSYTNDIFTTDYSVNNQIFTISNPTVDITSLTVQTIENAGATNTTYLQAAGILGLDGNSKVFFLQAARDYLYEFQFGDGILGYKPQNGAVVAANYRIAAGDVADDSGSFTLNYNLGNYNNTTISNVVITLAANSSGGSQAESIESIRFNGPLAYQTQERAVVATDYHTLILTRFPQVGDVNVYGGGISTASVDYGKVFVAMVSPTGNPLTKTNKDIITSYLTGFNILPIKDSVYPIDANTIWLDVTATVHIDFDETSNPPSYYETLATNTIINFSANTLDKFNRNYYHSQLSTALDKMEANNIMLGNETYFTMRRYANVSLIANNNLYVSFGNPVSNITSSTFIVNGQNAVIADAYPGVNTTPGTVNLVVINSNNSVNASQIGTINYTKGIISIPSLKIDSYTTDQSSFFISAVANTKVITVNNNDILKIDTVAGINVNVANGP